MPLISVIVPVYKVEHYLRRCVDSILAQTFSDFELILVNDGSPDNCGTICDEYANKDSRVHVIHQENKGVSAARNAGIDYAFGNGNSRWIAFVDSDDWIHPRYLEILYNDAIENDVRISVCRLQQIQEGEAVTAMNEAPPICVDAETACAEYYGVMVLSVLKLYDKSLFESIRFPVGKVYGEDTFVTHRLLFLCDRVTISPSVLYYYFQHSKSVVHSSWEQKHFDDIEAHEHRLQYLKENGYLKAYDAEKRVYIGRLYHHLEKIQQSKWRGSKHELLLRNKLRMALFRYRKKVGFSENKWIYERAYPKLMNIYWILCSARNKLMNILKHK